MSHETKQTEPNIHSVMLAIRELEKTHEVQAYLALLRSIGMKVGPEK